MRRRIHLASVLVYLSISLLLSLSGDVGEAAGPLRLLPAGGSRQSTNSVTSQTTMSATPSTWQTIVSQSFGPDGCGLPCPGWSIVNVADDPGPPWQVSSLHEEKPGNSRPGVGSTVWPLAGRARGDRSSLDVDRSNNPDARLIYGPFDLSHAVDAQVEFSTWSETQPEYGSLQVEVSTDGSHFTPLPSWMGSEPVTLEERGRLPRSLSLRDWTRYGRPSGESKVWVAWRTHGDFGDKYRGPLVDDIRILKLVPGTINVFGWVNYYNRQGNRIPAPQVTVDVIDYNMDASSQDLAYLLTGDDGRFHYEGIQNYDWWDANDPDTRLDLYIVVEASGWDSYLTTYHKVTYLAGGTHKWNEPCSGSGCNWAGPQWDVSDGDVELDYDVGINDPQREAMWLVRDARRAWKYVDAQSMPHSGSVILAWEQNQNCYLGICNSFFYAGPGGPYAFIQYQVTSSSDTVVHEIGHAYMYNATGYWYWWSGCWGHDIFLSKGESCAWSEGWADFFSLTVNGDRCYDKVSGPCGGTGQVEGTHYYDLENQGWSDTRPRGYTVEGRVAGALYDLYDSINEPSWDTAAEGFVPIWIIVRDSEPAIPTLAHFGIRWGNSGHSYFQFLLASYQNTIEYYNAL